jgi:Na+/H+-translocating membrane pyrophosphatase
MNHKNTTIDWYYWYVATIVALLACAASWAQATLNPLPASWSPVAVSGATALAFLTGAYWIKQFRLNWRWKALGGGLIVSPLVTIPACMLVARIGIGIGKGFTLALFISMASIVMYS